MNGYQRIKATLDGKKPDQIPVMLHNFLLAAREAGFSMHEYRENPKVIAEAFIRSVEKYHYDGIVVDIDTVTLAGALGVPVDFPLNEPARSPKGLLTNYQFLNIKPETLNIRNYRYINIWLESVYLLSNHFKNEVFIRGNCDQAPFTLASLLRGTQDWLTDLYLEDSGHLHELLEICTSASCSFIELMAQTGAHMVSNGDSASGPDMVSPQIYRDFALPYQKRVAEAAHAANLPWLLHICGNTDAILQDMIASGADCLELDYKTDVQLAHDLMINKVIFVGNIDPSGVLALGSAEKVRLKTRDLLEVFSDTPGFILNAGCAIPAETPEENIRAMIEVAREG